ncbi:hypothetical protein CR513_31543, partial [Mucuna pruriens]
MAMHWTCEGGLDVGNGDFVYPQVVTALDPVVIRTREVGVCVGGGYKVMTRGKCSYVGIQLGDIEITIEAYILDLVDLDMILGVAWLKDLGKVVMGWKEMTMNFLLKGNLEQLKRLIDGGTYVKKSILTSRDNGEDSNTRKQYLGQWKRLAKVDATGEDELLLDDQFPSPNLEDKVAPLAIGSDRASDTKTEVGLVIGTNPRFGSTKKSNHVGSKAQNSYHWYHVNALPSIVTMATWSFSESDTLFNSKYRVVLKMTETTPRMLENILFIDDDIWEMLPKEMKTKRVIRRKKFTSRLGIREPSPSQPILFQNLTNCYFPPILLFIISYTSFSFRPQLNIINGPRLNNINELPPTKGSCNWRPMSNTYLS